MDRLCRICRTSESVEELIGFYDNINVLVDFYFITGIMIVDIDQDNPALICSTCVDNIKMFTKFKRKAKKSDEFFREQCKSCEETFWNKERSENFGLSPFIKQEPELLTKISYWADIGNIAQTTCNVDFIDENDEMNESANNEAIDVEDSDGSGYFEENGPEFVNEFSEYCEITEKKPKANSEKSADDSLDDQDMSYHLNQSLNGKTLQCNVCGKEIKTNRSLKHHLSVVHNLDDKVYICKHCEKIFKHELYVKNHVKKHHGMQFLKSRDLIIKKIRNREKSQINIENKSKVNAEKFGDPNSKYCKICKREFSSVRTCRDHFKTAHGADKSVFVCRICEARFKIRLYVLRHVKKKHGIQATEQHYSIEEEESEEEEEFEEIDRDIVELAKPSSKDCLNYCCYCDKSFSSGRSYREHMKIRHDSDDKVYICTFCNDKFIVMTYLKRHVKKVHNHVLKAHEVIVKRKRDKKQKKVKIKKEVTGASENCVESTLSKME